MFACLSLPVPSAAPPDVSGVVEAVAREFSPRVEVHKPGLVTLDIAGLGRLLGMPEEIGRELQEACARRSLPASVAIATTRSAAMLLAVGKPGLAVVPAGEERRRLAPLPLACLGRAFPLEGTQLFAVLDRWGLKTLGDLARLPAAALSARIGQDGLAWQRLARGEDLQPLVAMPPAQPIEEHVDLDWPVEGLEPLSFVLARLFEPLADRLERLDQAATVLHATFRLSSRAIETRTLQLPAPMRDPKVLRTLILLHLESHPLGAGVDRVAVRVETAQARVTQFSLLGRALPFPEEVAPLVARLAALVGERRVGAPALVDTYRPGAFVMAPFVVSDRQGARMQNAQCTMQNAGGWGAVPLSPIPVVERAAECPPRYGGRREATSPWPPSNEAASGQLPAASGQRPAASCTPRVAIRRFRLPVAARVTLKDGRPVRVTTERRGLEGGMVESAAGPWRTSGEWWRVPDARVQVEVPGGPAHAADDASGAVRREKPVSGARLRADEEPPALRRGHAVAPVGSEEERRRGRTAFRREWPRSPLLGGPAEEQGERRFIAVGWNRDEWDVALSDGGVYRIYRDRSRDRWFVDGILD